MSFATLSACDTASTTNVWWMARICMKKRFKSKSISAQYALGSYSWLWISKLQIGMKLSETKKVWFWDRKFERHWISSQNDNSSSIVINIIINGRHRIKQHWSLVNPQIKKVHFISSSQKFKTIQDSFENSLRLSITKKERFWFDQCSWSKEELNRCQPQLDREHSRIKDEKENKVS